MKYLRMFDNVAERAATLRENDEISIVSFTKSNQMVDIKMPVDPLEAPFWIDNLSGEPNTVTISKSYWSNAYSVKIEKSANMKRWVFVEYSGSGARITIAPYGRIYLRFSLDDAKISSLSGYMNEGISANNIDASKPYAIGGNILSLLNGPLYVPGERLFNSQQIGGSIKNDVKIGTYAELFKNSTTLVDASRLTLPNNLTTYMCYYNMFGGCTSLTKAPALPATVMENLAYSNMFNGCSSLETLPEISGSEISVRMFYNCIGMSDVTVPNTITTIGTEAFYNALNINYTGSATGSPWGAKSVNGYVDGDFVYTDNTKTTLVACSSAVTSAVIPNTVTTISDNAFNGCTNLTSVTIPSSVTSIGNNAFSDCTGLTSVTIPSSVTSIGNSAFSGCTRLNTVTIPSSVTSIGNSAFSGCTRLNTVTVPDTVTTIGSYAFYNVLNITYNGSATGSPWGALSVNGYVDGDIVYTDNTKTTLAGCNKSATSVVIPNTVTTIGNNAFRYCDKLTSVTVPASVTSIGNNAFSDCPVLVEFECLPTTPPTLPTLSSYNVFSNTPKIIIEVPQGYADTYSSASGWSNSSTRITDGVYGIEYTSTNGETVTPFSSAGFNASILSNTYDTVGFIRFNKPVTTIGNQSYQNCTTLASITIPNTVTSIGKNAFENVKLFSVDVPNTVTSIGTNAFKGTINVNYTGTATGSPWGALTWNSYVEGDLVYTDSTKTTITKCNPSATSVTIPSSVTTISNTAFQSCTGLTSITIPDNVTSIGESAFKSCTGLTSVTIGSGITTISGSAFQSCTGLTSITIPDNVTSINGSAFKSCTHLTSITIPDSVTSIGNQAFQSCTGLTSITLGTGITTVPSYMFANCTGLTSVTIPSGITGIDQYAFSECSGLTSVTIPNTVTSIGASAFSGCTGLTSVTIPSSVTSIGNSAFSGCTNLFTVTVPDTVTTIGSSAFYGVTILYYNGTATGSPWGAKCVNGYIEGDFIYNDNTKTELKAYIGTSTTVNIPDTVTTIGGSAFKGNTTVITINMPSTVSEIGGSAFNGCTNLTLVNLSPNLTSIGASAFGGCTNLVGNMYIPNGVTTINSGVFYNCSSLTSVRLPDSVTSIGTESFRNCTALTSITLPSTLTSIGQSAFDTCSGLSGNITIPNGVTNIPSYAFYGCTSLDNITIPNTVSTIGTDAFKNVSNIIYSGPAATGSPWGAKSVNGYADGDFVYTNNTKTEIKKYVGTSTTVTIPNTVTSISQQAFRGNTTITSVTMSDSVTSIGQEAFYNCSNLESITLSNNITTINNSTFSVSGLTSIVIPEGVTSIGGMAFNGCDVLSSVTIPNTVTSIGSNAFSGCDLLKNVTIPASVTSIGSNAFYDISGTLGGASVTCKATTPPTLGSNVFTPTYIIQSPTIYVPASVVSTYKSASGWSDFSNKINPIPDGIVLSQDSNVATIDTTGLTSGTGYYTINGGSQVSISEGVTTFAITQAMNNQTLLVHGQFGSNTIEETMTLSWVDYSPIITVTENNNYVTITAPAANVIQYRLGSSGEYTNYTEPVYIASDTTIYVTATRTVSSVVYATNSSQAVTHTLVPPTNLTISCLSNIVTMYADNATTFEYRFSESGSWTTYTEPFVINQNRTVYGKASNSDGYITKSQDVTYVDYAPDVTIAVTDNYATITSETAETITYRLGSSGEYTSYTEPVYVESTTTMYVIATRTVVGVVYTANVSQTVTHEYLPPSNLTISCTRNIVTITADDATALAYRFNESDSWTTYTEPFEITETVTVYGKASNIDGVITDSQECEYDSSFTPFYIEDISGSDNTISIKKSNNSSTAPTLSIQKSLDGITWETMGSTSTTAITATVPANGKLYLRCSTNSWSNGSASYYNYFSGSTGNFNVGGNINSLLYGSSFNGQTAFKANYTYIFTYLFQSSKIVSAAKLLLPATTLYNYCYYYMFYGCTALTTAPALPATTLAQYCYYSMFQGCTALTTAPSILPATTLTNYCYYQMFRGCTSLTTAPTLPATTVVNQCYYYMFQNCTNLNYVKCLLTNPQTNYSADWLSGVASSGTFVKSPNVTWATGASGIPVNWTVGNMGLDVSQSLNVARIELFGHDSGTGYYTINGGSQVSVNEGVVNIPITQAMNNQTLYVYSEFDGEPVQDTLTLEWVDYTPSITITETDNVVTITSATADTIQYRIGSSGEYTSYTEPVYIETNGTIYVTATRTVSNIEYTANESQAVTHTYLPPSNLTISCLGALVRITATSVQTIEYRFSESDPWITYTQPFMISQTVTVYARATNVDGSITASQECVYNAYGLPFYIEDISGNTNTIQLRKYISAPTLTIQKSDNGVNWETIGETSTAMMIDVPANSKVFLRCSATAWGTSSYYNYFSTSTGNFNVGGNINSLLYGDTFTDQSEFPSGVGTYALRSLLYSNTHVVNAVNLLLPATTLTNYCYKDMFNGCTSLATAPTLPATTLTDGCYQSMFQSCTSLAIAPTLPATTAVQYCYNSMFNGCTSLTTAPALPATTLNRNCYQSMFNGCTSLTTAPALPATTLAQYCYYSMFNGCTSLTTAPALPATTLTNYCYYQMFRGCTNLNYIKCLATTIGSDSVNNWVNGVSSTGTFVKNPSMSSWSRNASGIPSGWTVEDAAE